jgi:hypothetical protein
MKKMKVKYLISLLAISGILLIAFLCIIGRQNKIEIYSYLPELEKHELHNVKIKKIYADPSYVYPYSVVMNFDSDDKAIIQLLGLKNVETIDTTALKRSSWIEEYDLYFSMNSVNAVRYPSIQKKLDGIDWWKVNECSHNYAAPFLDSDDKKNIVGFNQRNNGRIVCCKNKTAYFILLECWH